MAIEFVSYHCNYEQAGMVKGEEQVSEGLIAQIWKRQLVRNDRLVTSDGQRLQVVHLGMENHDRGPDFLGAVITIEEVVVKGDIELHVRASDWKAHGHHRDPQYNGVILQVVLWNDVTSPAILQDGHSVPILALDRCLDGPWDEVRRQALVPCLPAEPCRGAGKRLGSIGVLQLLEEAGEDWFQSKAALFQAELASEQGDEVLYRGIMRALGYTGNKESFQELARRLPLRVIETVGRDSPLPRQSIVLQALLLGTAGLLGLRQAPGLERIWHSLGARQLMDKADWHFFRVRPGNSPLIRLTAAAYVLSRYLEKGLVAGVLDLVVAARPGTGYHDLESGFIVADGGQRALLGRGRAREIVVNIILPFFFAWASITSRPRLGEHALELYRCCPKLDENRITRRLGQFLGGGSSWDLSSARCQQGLVHIYNNFCSNKGCARCPLGFIPA